MGLMGPRDSPWNHGIKEGFPMGPRAIPHGKHGTCLQEIHKYSHALKILFLMDQPRENRCVFVGEVSRRGGIVGTRVKVKVREQRRWCFASRKFVRCSV